MTDDAALYVALGRGDTSALATLYDRHVGVVYRLALHAEHRDSRRAEDRVHDVFLDLARAARRGAPILHVLRWLVVRVFELRPAS